jgi:hypothetical protein
MHSRILKFSVLSWAVIGILSGCESEVEITDGEIPAQYLKVAQSHTGTYVGKFNGVPGELTLSLQGRRAVLSYKNQFGSDLVDPSCQSIIGDLLKVGVEGQDASNFELKSARFAFSANRCFPSVEGKEVVLSFSEKSGQRRIDVSLVRRSQLEQNCRWDGGDPSRGIPPREYCERQLRTDYYSGRFGK